MTSTTEAEYLLMERGNAAEQLLQSEIFQVAANALTNHHLESILRSAPEDCKARESGYHQARAVQDIVGVLNQWVAVRDQIVLAAASEEEDSDDTDPEFKQ
jgi:hypothetical protein